MIVFSCAKTGGHIYPAISVAQELDMSALFITTPGKQQQAIITRYGYDVSLIPELGFNPFVWVMAFFKSCLILTKSKAKGVVCTGGAVSCMVAFVAWLYRIPVIVLEQNCLPGRANRLCQRFATKVCVSFEESSSYFKQSKVVVTGNPVRKTYFSDACFQQFKKESLGGSPVILVFGGSQGALWMNEWIQKQYDFFLNNKYVLLHITGADFYKKHYSDPFYHVVSDSENRKKIYTFPYFEKMDYLYSLSDLVICRAGATSIAELLHFKTPSILVPYPYAADQHQLLNAKSLEKQNLSVCIEQPDMVFSKVQKNFSVYIEKQRVQLEESYNVARQQVAEIVECVL
ncbi:hypothetical protein DID77_04595 [Candidatus Marinamargulisbacteria bacterium SCGC AG-439-L15]|nr:hypothetical protein DID77_04595 [Candidatus Marinamargulisbacteria bacterium SCGC AG-439-L15]